jgi:hypothetical protein
MMTQLGGSSLYSRSAEKAIHTTRAWYHGHSTGSRLVAAKHFCSCREPLRDCAAPEQLRTTGSQLGCCFAIGWLNPGVAAERRSASLSSALQPLAHELRHMGWVSTLPSTTWTTAFLDLVGGGGPSSCLLRSTDQCCVCPCAPQHALQFHSFRTNGVGKFLIAW